MSELLAGVPLGQHPLADLWRLENPEAFPLDAVSHAPMLTRRNIAGWTDRPSVTVTIRRDADVERWVSLVEALMAVRLQDPT